MKSAATKLGEGSGVGPMPSPGTYAQKAATAKADGESAKANLTGGSGSAAEQQAPRISSAATAAQNPDKSPFEEPSTYQCVDCGRTDDHYFCLRWMERLRLWLGGSRERV